MTVKPMVLVLFSLFVISCANVYLPTEPEPQPCPPEEEDEDSRGCGAACENLARLKCPGWRGSPGPDEVFGTEDDVSCVDACQAILSEETATLYLACTTSATSCEEVVSCFE